MNGVKGKFLKKLKTIKTVGYLQPDRILHVDAAGVLIDKFFAKSSDKSEKELMQIENKNSVLEQGYEVIDVLELMKDLEDEDVRVQPVSDSGYVEEDKENVRPVSDPGVKLKAGNGNSKSFGDTPLSKTDISSFRPPDLDSDTLFDPKLLAAFRQAVEEFKAQEEKRRNRVLRDIEHELDQIPDDERPLKTPKLEEIDNPLLDFEKICPPGGSDSVIFYTTGLRSIRKTFEDCSSIRFLLESFKVLYHERDLSMHLDFRDELFRILGGKTVPPRLFIKGRYIGGAEEVLRLHEQGKFRPLLAGIPLNTSHGPCEGCAGVRFVMCVSCDGSRKVDSGDGLLRGKCMKCNENGLIICPVCC
ncbi:putative glutaredoxin, Thioredoxin-like superfamily [Helianthus debilis subsp. tardiflorus]